MGQAPPYDAQAAILGPVSNLTRRIEIYEQDSITRWKSGDEDDRLIGGSVSLDYSRDERRSYSLTLENEDFGLEHEEGQFWYDKIIKVYSGVKYVDSTQQVTTQLVRTNLASNPNAGTVVTGFGTTVGTGGAASGARITTANSPAATTGFETTWTAATTAVSGGTWFMMPVGSGTVTPGNYYSGRLYGRSTKAQTLQMGLQFYNDAGTLIGSTFVNNSVAVTANTWNEFKVEGAIAPSGATRVLVYLYAVTGGSNWAINDKLAINGIMIESAASLANSFTGATQSFANRVYAWVGSAENSRSTETTTVVVTTPVNRTWERQIGEFMIDSISEDHFPYVVSVNGRDYTKKCMLSKFVNPTAFAIGTKVEDAIKAIAQNAGITKFILPLTGQTFATDYFFERNSSRWEAMKQIANAFGYEIFFDAQGYLVIREYQDPITAPISYTMETGPFGTLVSYGKTVNDTRIYNHIVVVGETTDQNVIPVWGEALNTEPSSPTRIAELGDRTYQYSSPFITTTAQAQDLAKKYLKIMSLEEFNLDFSSIAMPWLEVGEIIEFLDPRKFGGQPTRFLLSSLTLPLGLGPMSGNAKRISIVS